MISFNSFYQQIAQNRLTHWLNVLPAQLTQWQSNELHGEFKHWVKTLDALPVTTPSHIDLSNSVTVGSSDEISNGEHKRLENLLKKFKP